MTVVHSYIVFNLFLFNLMEDDVLVVFTNCLKVETQPDGPLRSACLKKAGAAMIANSRPEVAFEVTPLFHPPFRTHRAHRSQSPCMTFCSVSFHAAAEG